MLKLIEASKPEDNMHTFFSPANALYEIIMGLTCLAIVFTSVLSIPTMVAMFEGSKEEADRQNQ
jgi:hypothetical protein